MIAKQYQPLNKQKMNSKVRFRVDSNLNKDLDKSIKTFNEISPHISFSKSDVLRLALSSFCKSILTQEVKIQIDLPESITLIPLTKCGGSKKC